MMTYRGQVKNGVVVFRGRSKPAEGTDVRIQPVKKPGKKRSSGNGSTVGQRMLKLAGIANGLPSDMAHNHDHYIHGTPRK